MLSSRGAGTRGAQLPLLPARRAAGAPRQKRDCFCITTLFSVFYSVFVLFSVFKGVLVLYSVLKGVLVLYSVFKGVLVLYSVFKGVLVLYSVQASARAQRAPSSLWLGKRMWTPVFSHGTRI